MKPKSDDTEQMTARIAAVAHHDAEAERFKRWYGQMAQGRFANAFTYGRHKIDVLLDQSLKQLPPGARILDVGCGTGEYIHRANALGFLASGLEPAAAMRQAAIATNPDSTIVDGVATQLPFPANSFELVICIEVLRYLHGSDIREAMREMHRVLMPGGQLFLTMVNKYALDGFVLHYHLQRLLKGGRLSSALPHCEFVTPGRVDKMLRATGFSAVRHRGVLFAPMRILYKLSEPLAGRLAPRLERIDDAICSVRATTPFAGHLVTIATR